MEKEKVTRVFSQRLKELRKKSKLSQDDLAAALEISKGSLSYYENMQRVPDIVTLDRIAAYFKVSTDYLLGRTKAATERVEIKTICDYLFLDEKTVAAIRQFAQEYEDAQGEFGAVIRSEWFNRFMKDINELACAMWKEDLALQEEQKIDPNASAEAHATEQGVKAAEKIDLIKFRIIKNVFSFFVEYEKEISDYMEFKAIPEPKGDPRHGDDHPPKK